MPREVIESCPSPEGRQAVEVVVLGDDDRPIPGLSLVLDCPGEGKQGDVTDARGRCRFEGIPRGQSSRLAIAGLHQDAWELVTTLPMADDAARSRVRPSWSATTPKDAPATTVEAPPGHCLIRLGYEHGFLPQTLWDENASAWGPRHAKAVLTPNMKVALPVRTVGWVDAPAGSLVVLHRIGLPVVMTLRVVDTLGRAWAGCPYSLALQGSSRPMPKQVGRTDRGGQLHAPVLPDVTRGTLTIEPRSGQRRWVFQLEIGTLRPADEPEGAAARLWNMGFRAGHNPFWREGEVLATYQRDGLAQDPAELDDSVAAALVDWHGS